MFQRLIILCGLANVFLLLSTSLVLAGDTHTPQDFQKEFFSPTAVSYFGALETKAGALSLAQKRALLDAKGTFVSFIKATQEANAPLAKFLGPNLLKLYKSRNELLSKLIGQETEILIVAATGFDLREDEAIHIKYYAVLFSEGNLLIREDAVDLRRLASGWKIVRIGGIE